MDKKHQHHDIITDTWATTGFYPEVGKLGVWGQNSPAGCRDGAPVEAWGLSPQKSTTVY